MLERLSPMPAISPTAIPAPPRLTMKRGRIGIIISLPKSVRRLVKPRSTTFTPAPEKRDLPLASLNSTLKRLE
jgi:hypothetical protein